MVPYSYKICVTTNTLLFSNTMSYSFLNDREGGIIQPFRSGHEKPQDRPCGYLINNTVFAGFIYINTNLFWKSHRTPKTRLTSNEHQFYSFNPSVAGRRIHIARPCSTLPNIFSSSTLEKQMIHGLDVFITTWAISRFHINDPQVIEIERVGIFLKRIFQQRTFTLIGSIYSIGFCLCYYKEFCYQLKL